MSITQNIEINKIKELQERVKKEKETFKKASHTRKFLSKKLNSLIQPSFINSGIYKEFTACITFQPETREEIYTILNTFKANMYYQTQRKTNCHKFTLINKKEECEENNIKISSYIFFVQKYSSTDSEYHKLEWVYKQNKNIYKFTIELPFDFHIGHYSYNVEYHYGEKYIKNCQFHCTHTNISKYFNRLQYASYNGMKEYKFYSEFTFLNILEILELKNTQTIDELLKLNKDFLLKAPYMLNRYIKYTNKYQDLKFETYLYKNSTTNNIYLKTAKGSLYVPIQAFLNNDIQAVKQYHSDYHNNYYKDNKKVLAEKIAILNTEEAQKLFEIMEGLKK